MDTSQASQLLCAERQTAGKAQPSGWGLAVQEGRAGSEPRRLQRDDPLNHKEAPESLPHAPSLQSRAVIREDFSEEAASMSEASGWGCGLQGLGWERAKRHRLAGQGSELGLLGLGLTRTSECFPPLEAEWQPGRALLGGRVCIVVGYW